MALDPAGSLALLGHGHPDGLHLRRAAAGLRGEGFRPGHDELRIGSRQGDVHDPGPAEDLRLGVVGRQQVGHVRHEGRAGARLKTPGHITRVVGGREQDQLGLMPLGQLLQREGCRLREELRVEGVVVGKYGLGSVLAQRRRGLRGPRAQRHGRNRGAQLAGLGQQLEGRWVDLASRPDLRIDPDGGHAQITFALCRNSATFAASSGVSWALIRAAWIAPGLWRFFPLDCSSMR